MNNYHYIVAGLPVLDRDYKFTAESPETILEGPVFGAGRESD